MAKILLIEADEEVSNLITLDLKAKKHTPTVETDTLPAMKRLTNEKFDIVITPADSPTTPGLKFIEWVLKNTQSAVIVHGFPPLAKAKEAFELGVSDFINNPYQVSELYEAINNIKKNPISNLSTSTSSRVNIDSGYTKMPIEEFSPHEKSKFDVYVRLSEFKYLKVCSKNRIFPADRAASFKEKKVDFLYLKKEDFRKLVSFSIKAIRGAKNDKRTSREEQLRFVEATNDAILKVAYIQGIDKESFDIAKDFLTSAVTVLAENFDAKSLVESLNAKSEALFNHSLGVALYSILIARKLSFTSSQVFFKLGLAGLFHDIGKKELPPELFWKSRALLTPSERALVNSHAERSYKILSKISYIPSEIVQLVREHHEDMKGKGYPRGLTKSELHPLSKILITSNLFVERVIKTRETVAMPIHAAFKDMEETYDDRLDLETMTALKALFPR